MFENVEVPLAERLDVAELVGLDVPLAERLDVAELVGLEVPLAVPVRVFVFE